MWCWRRVEKISWTDHMRNEEVLLKSQWAEEYPTWNKENEGYLRRNCLLKQVIEGKIKGEKEVTRGRGRRCKKLLDDLKDRKGYSHFKEEALDCNLWRARFGRGFGPVIRQNTEWMKNDMTKTITRSKLLAILNGSGSTNNCLHCTQNHHMK